MATSVISVNNDQNRASSSLPGSNNEQSPGEFDRDKASVAARCPQHRPGTVLNPVAFDTLAEASDELWIELEGQLYRLRKTKQGKLILTK